MGLGFLCPTSIFLSLIKNKWQINAPAVNCLKYDIKKMENFVWKTEKEVYVCVCVCVWLGGGGGGGGRKSYAIKYFVLES